MSIFYKSLRIGKNGKEFYLYKFKTLKDNFDKTDSFADESAYLPLGKFLRKTHLDELPQLWNLIKGDLNIFGWRPEEKRYIDLWPEKIKKKILSNKPGLIDLATIVFFNEEKLLKEFNDKHYFYWQFIRPLKFQFQLFYIENKCFLLKITILWIIFKKIICSLWKD